MTGLVVDHWAADIKRLRLPMPAFDGVNSFILGVSDRQTVVDTGMPGGETASLWQSALRDRLLDNVDTVLCTHGHIDHVGQAGLLTRETGAALVMSGDEYEDVFRLSQMSLAQRRELGEAFHGAGGFPLAGRAQPTDYSVLAPFPEHGTLLRDGDVITLGGIAFEVLLGGGHSRAPICLLSRTRKILFAGDQLLIGSGPQVPVQPERPEDDVLGAYFHFLDRLEALPDDLLVFPGHGEPIRNFRQLVARIRDGHQQRLIRLLTTISGAMTCAEMAPLIFTRPPGRLSPRLPYLMRGMANYLVARSELQVRSDADVLKYQRKQ